MSLTKSFDYRKMRSMANRKYLQPAYGVIMRFGGPEGKLTVGVETVAAITKRDPSWVYRWMYPKERGGTGGLIPSREQKKLFDYAQKKRLPLEPEDFFSARAA